MATECDTFHSLTTNYNDDPSVPPYVGIFFEIAALTSTIDILTLEIDLIDYGDLHVEVYVVKDKFENLHQEPSSWTLVANTTLVPAPEGPGRGAIVPLQDFEPIRVHARQRASIYVSLDAPKLDHTVFALSKTGDVHTRNADLQMFVGAGTHSLNKFPDTLDTTLDPMFAGVVHYETTQCEISQVTTTTQHSFLVDMDPDQFREELTNYFDSLLQGDSKFLVEQFGLEKPVIENTVSLPYPYVCPDTWKDCPKEYLQTQVSWTHSEALSSGMLQYELYRPDALNHLGAKVLNLGLIRTAAQFTIHLEGASVSDNVKYFEDVTKRFLELTVPDKASVWDVEVQPDESRRLRQSQSSVVRGVVRGGVRSSTKTKEFRFAVDIAFRNEANLYESLLVESGRLRPGYNGASETFKNLSGVTATVTAYDGAMAKSDSGRNTTMLYTCVAVGVASLVIVFYLLYLKYKQVVDKRQREDSRRKRRAERRERRNCRTGTASEKEQAKPKLQRANSLTESSSPSDTFGSEIASTSPRRADRTRQISGTVGFKAEKLHPSTENSQCGRVDDIVANTSDKACSVGGYRIGNYTRATTR